VVEDVGEVSGITTMCGSLSGWSELAGPRARVGELVGGEESGLSWAILTNQTGQRASPGINEGVRARN
jgi:hypothetical protein